MNVRKVIHELYREEKALPLDGFWQRGACGAFPGKVAKALTGTDPTEEVRALFSTETEAGRLMVSRGWASVADFAATVYPEVSVAQARPGDWAAVANPDGSKGLGVVIGSQIAVATARGLGTVELLRATNVYRVA